MGVKIFCIDILLRILIGELVHICRKFLRPMRLELAFVMGAVLASAERGYLARLAGLPQTELEDELTRMFDDGVHSRLGKAFSIDKTTDDGYGGNLVRGLLGEMAGNLHSADRLASIWHPMLRNEKILEEMEKKETYDGELVRLLKIPVLAEIFYGHYMIGNSCHKLVTMIRRNLGFGDPLISDKNVAEKFCGYMSKHSDVFDAMKKEGIDPLFMDRLARAFIASGYWLGFDNLNSVAVALSERMDIFADLWDKWGSFLVKKGIGKSGLSMNEMGIMTRNGKLDGEFIEDLIGRLVRFDRIYFLGNLLRRRSTVIVGVSEFERMSEAGAVLFEKMCKAGKLDGEIEEGFGRRISSYSHYNPTYVSDWLENVPRVSLLLENKKFDRTINELLKKSIWGHCLPHLKALLTSLERSKGMFGELVRSGEFDECLISWLDELADSDNAKGGEDLLRLLLKENKSKLIAVWLKRLSIDWNRHFALKILLKILPETRDMLKKLLSKEKWKSAAKEYRGHLTRNGPEDELDILEGFLPESKKRTAAI